MNKTFLCLASAFLLGSFCFIHAADPIAAGKRRELMLDDFLFESVQNLTFRQHTIKDEERVLDLNADWEGRKYFGITACGYPVVFRDGDLYRMYYASYYGLRLKPLDVQQQFTCYAESRDGITWNRVHLRKHAFQGNTNNNILLKGQTSHNFAPFIDTRPNIPADEKYKAVGGNGKAYVFASSDGLNWRKLREAPILDGEEPAFDRYDAIRWGVNPDNERAILDSLNVAYWDSTTQRYVLNFRAYLPCLNRDGTKMLKETRSVMRCTSKDFRHWENIEPIRYGEPRRSEIHSLYTSNAQPYFRAPHLIIGLPLRTANRRPFAGTSFGMSETAFMYSRDTLNYTLFDEALMRPGRDVGNWSKHGNLTAWGLLQTSDDELSAYYLQRDHQKDTYIRRGTIRIDGFRSLYAGRYPGGEAISHPLVFKGNCLGINAQTGANGGITIGFLDADTQKPIKGFEKSNEFYGDQIQTFIHFGNGRDISMMSGRRIRLKISMYNANLYSLKFSGS